MERAPSFYLTQRLRRRTTFIGKPGFDRWFACEYMGSAEFEWGALPEALARLRAAKRLGIHEGHVTRRGITKRVYVVGDVKRIQAVPDALTAWMVDAYPRGKEMTYFPEHVDDTARDHQAETVAWWSLSDDVMWSLDADIARQLLEAVTERVPKKVG